MKLADNRMAHRLSILVLTFCSCALFNLPASAEVEWFYTVKPGDTLIHFGRAYLINPDDWRTLQTLNRIKDPYRIPVGSTLRVPLGLLRQVAAEAKVVKVLGQAEWVTGNQTSVVLTPGQMLGPGAQIQTLANSQVTLQFADGSLTTLSSNGTLVLDTMSLYSGGAMVDTTLRLQHGQAATTANPKHTKGNSMQIITPSAIAAVRGTQFRVNVEQASTTQATLDGQVALSANSSEVLVNQGYGSQAVLGQPPIAPVSLLPAVDTSQFALNYHTLPIVLHWTAHPSAVTWQADIRSLSGAQMDEGAIVSEYRLSEPKLAINTLPDGRYLVNLRAIDQHGIAGFDATHVLNVDQHPQPPVALFPTQAIYEQTPLLRWHSVESASAYLLELKNETDAHLPVLSVRVDQPYFQLSQPLLVGDYSWRLATLMQSKAGVETQSAWSLPTVFKVKPLPPAPDISQMMVSVAWNRVLIELPQPATHHQYQFNLDNPRNDQKDVWVYVGTETRHQLLLKEYGQQLLHVRLIDADGVVGPSASYSFNASPP
jgi:hypothetical protein